MGGRREASPHWSYLICFAGGDSGREEDGGRFRGRLSLPLHYDIIKIPCLISKQGSSSHCSFGRQNSAGWQDLGRQDLGSYPLYISAWTPGQGQGQDRGQAVASQAGDPHFVAIQTDRLPGLGCLQQDRQTRWPRTGTPTKPLWACLASIRWALGGLLGLELKLSHLSNSNILLEETNICGRLDTWRQASLWRNSVWRPLLTSAALTFRQTILARPLHALWEEGDHRSQTLIAFVNRPPVEHEGRTGHSSHSPGREEHYHKSQVDLTDIC